MFALARKQLYVVDVHLEGKAILAVDAVAPMLTEVAFRMYV